MRKSDKPVVLVALAGGNAEDERYVRDLRAEQQRVDMAVDLVATIGHCEIVTLNDATPQSIVDTFSDERYQHRIALLHYGAHGGGTSVVDKQAGGESLATFLGRQRGLELVFLNGCGSEDQARTLMDAGVGAVILTYQAIKDAVATEFAGCFYQSMAGGASIRTAFHEAEDSIRIQHEETPKSTFRDFVPAVATNRWPWDLAVRKGADITDRWSFPRAAGDPYFGIPTPKCSDLPDSPFLHLKWFSRDEVEIFFGRGRKIRELYEAVVDPNSEPIIMLFGASGVGKSSLLDAGIVPRLDQAFNIHYLRRDGTIGLTSTLAKFFEQSNDGDAIAQAWRDSEADRPTVVVLDQVEEAYTRPNRDDPEEVENFMDVLTRIFTSRHSRPKGRLILGFRKEWLAEIITRLKEFKLQNTMVEIEHLKRDEIIEAINGPTSTERLREAYNLTVEEGLPETIANDLIKDHGAAIAPTLQILLTKMWQLAKKADSKSPRFTLQMYQRLKEQGILLGDFVEEQFQLLHKWRPRVVDTGLALDVMAFHTTDMGTAQTRKASHVQDMYNHCDDLVDLLQWCKDHFLLTGDFRVTNGRLEGQTRLAHDTLAPIIWQRYDESNHAGQRATRILHQCSLDRQSSGDAKPLEIPALAVVEAGQYGMRAWTPDEERLIEASRIRRDSIQRAQRIRTTGIIAATILIVITAAIALKEKRVADQRARVAQTMHLSSESQVEANDHPVRSILLAVEALRSLDPQDPSVGLPNTALRNAIAKCGGTGLGGHTDSILTSAISSNSRWLITGSRDATARLWDLNSENPLDDVIELKGHRDGITQVGFTSDGHWAVTASWGDKTVRLWDLGSGKPASNVKVLDAKASGHRITSLAISENNRWVVTGGESGSIIRWDLESPDFSFKLLEGHEGAVSSLAVSGDSRRMVSGSRDKTARVWDLSVAQPNDSVIVLNDHNAAVLAVAISSDTRFIATATGDSARPDRDSSVRVWDLNADDPTEPVHHLQGHKEPVRHVAFTSNVKFVFSAGDDRVVRRWELNAEDIDESMRTFEGHTGSIASMVISPLDHSLITAADDKTIRIWDLSSQSTQPKHVLTGHERPVRAMAVSPNGRTLATGGLDAMARLWSLEASNPGGNTTILKGHDDRIYAMARTSDARWLFTSGRDHVIRRWDLQQADPGRSSTAFRGHKSSVDFLQVSSDDRWLVTGGLDAAPKLWDLSMASPESSGRELNGDIDSVTGMAITSDSKWLIIAGHEKVRAWNLKADDPTKSVMHLVHATTVTSISVDPSGRWLATGDAVGVTRVWDLTLDDPSSSVVELSGHEGWVHNTAFNSTGRWLITGGSDSIVRLWDLKTPGGDYRNIDLDEHAASISALRVSPDSRWLITGDEQGNLIRWNLLAPRPQDTARPLRGPEGGINSLAFSSNSQWLLCGCRDQVGRMWNLNVEDPNRTLVELHGHTDDITFVDVTDDFMITGSSDATCRVWTFDTDKLILKAKRLAGRNMSDLEWGEYFPSDEYRATFKGLPNR